jgi:hypothetical protein
MTYDTARGVTVLFGGNDGIRNLGDTWEWDGSSWELGSPLTRHFPFGPRLHDARWPKGHHIRTKLELKAMFPSLTAIFSAFRCVYERRDQAVLYRERPLAGSGRTIAASESSPV